ncbi:MAG: UbiA family prenyltransferase [Candidatus Omnitrophota bacterium]
MMKIRDLVVRCEDKQIGLGLWLATALAVIFLRNALEVVVEVGAVPFIHPFHLVHMPLFFLSLLVCVIVILHFFSGEAIARVSRLALCFFPIIILPVIIDFVVVLLTDRQISYGYISFDVGRHFIHFFNPFHSIPYFPLSLRFEILCITVMSFAYVYFKRQRIFLSLLGALTVFGIYYFFVAIPGIFVNLCAFCSPLSFRLGRFLARAVGFGSGLNSGLVVTEGTLTDPNLLIVELIPLVVATIIWYYRCDKNKWLALAGNLRWTRSVHYMLLTCLGFFFYLMQSSSRDYFLFLKVVGMLSAVFFAFQFSVVTNDFFDVECDRVSNAGRPLVKRVLEPKEYLRVGFIYLAFALLFAFWVGDTCFTLVLLFIVLYLIYSAPPLQLKRNFLTSGLVIGLAALLCFLIGQITLQEEGVLDYRYVPIWYLVFLVFFLSSPVKDLKDIKGDRKCGVRSLPVVLGEVRGRQMTALLVFFSYCFIPFALCSCGFFACSVTIRLVSFAFAMINLIVISRPHAKEQHIFFLYFIYTLLLVWILKIS